MHPTLNASLKAEYAAYCAQERARHYSPVSYELWLEVTLNACRLDLANAQRAVHLPDSYRAALEQVHIILVKRIAQLTKILDRYNNLDVSQDALTLLALIESVRNGDVQSKREITEVLGGKEPKS